MAWQVPATRTTPLPQDAKADDSSFPGLKPSGRHGESKIEYQELQHNELLALEAIYGEDFVLHPTAHTAWKKSEPSFEIRIRPSSDEDLVVVIAFVMNATYPKTPPLLTIKLAEVQEATLFKIQKFLENEPKAFAKDAQEMIDKIVEGVRDILEAAAQAKAAGKQLPSLEEERELHEAKMAELAQQQKQEEEWKRLEESKEEERVMAEMLTQQIDRQKQKGRESKIGRRASKMYEHDSTTDLSPENRHILLDQPCSINDRSGGFVTFQAVTGKTDPREGHVSTVYAVRPVLGSSAGNFTIALKEAVIRRSESDTGEFKKRLQSLERRLQELNGGRSFQHKHLVEIFDFKVESILSASPATTNSWNVSILTPLADKGSLEDLLELAGYVEVGKVRSWTRDLLDALNYLHNKSIAHEDMHTGNILLFREPTGEIVPKISDASYQRELHNLSTRKRDLPSINSAKSAYWLPPEVAAVSNPQYNYKTDIWDFGVVFVQMVFGVGVLRKYSSPKNLMESLPLSKPLRELIGSFFKDKQKRPRAFELGSSEFLATDAPVLQEDPPEILESNYPAVALPSLPARRRESTNTRTLTSSRYTEDFVEEGRLGKGGFGEVVKARKKLDGRFYAIKKITQRSQAGLTEILKEVRLLSRIDHPAVVRYFNTWLEEVPILEDTATESSTATDGSEQTGATESSAIDIQFATSTGGLDFMSSNAAVEFAYDDDSDEVQSSDSPDEDDSSFESDMAGPLAVMPHKERAASHHRRASRFAHPFRTILYISMEYCEKRTLRDLITRKLHKNTAEIWRLFRQILEGLAHIHGLSIVHRDLKPENIFISSSGDGDGKLDNVKIGDFGLATSGQFSVDKAAANNVETDDLTRSIGTLYYSAPEVRSVAHGIYSTKVDMYSLGIIFFEMCYQPMMGMQKADVITQLRRPKPVLPSDFKPESKVQTEIVLSLVDHNPKERPSSSELLQSGKLPVPMETETIRRTLAGLADPTSPYYHKMLSELFRRPVDPAKDYAWDMFAAAPTAADLLSRGTVKQTLTSIFRHHGALEVQRSSIYPRSSHYGDNAVPLLDQNGTVLQLPFDLTLGSARMMAKQSTYPPIQRIFTFGQVFRDKHDTGQPQMFGEVDFDIVTVDTLDLALKEAEVLKVLDEIICSFPSLLPQMCFHVGHSDLLQLIFDHCGIVPAARQATADVLSKLNIHGNTWQKIKSELRSPVGISATSIDELQRFDFRDTPNKAFSRLKAAFEGSDVYESATSTIAHVKEVLEYTKRFKVGTKIYIYPLSSLKENFYKGGILFSCLYDKKVKDVFAAGGRYDQLIKDQRPKIGGNFNERHAVGFSLAWERLARSPKSTAKSSVRKTAEDGVGAVIERRCDVLVASFDGAVLRSSGAEILQQLWAQDISAEIVRDARSPEDLLSRHRDDGYSWIVIIKQDSMVKVKSIGNKDVSDTDMHKTQLLPWIIAQVRERDYKTNRPRGGPSQGDSSSSGGPGGGSGSGHDSEQRVTVLIAQTKSKKGNRQTVIEQAQAHASGLVQSFLRGPILAIETTDQVMELVRDTHLSEPESWRRVEHAVTTSEKKYVREIQAELQDWRDQHLHNGATRHSFLYNFRTSTCIYYDLAA